MLQPWKNLITTVRSVRASRAGSIADQNTSYMLENSRSCGMGGIYLRNDVPYPSGLSMCKVSIESRSRALGKPQSLMPQPVYTGTDSIPLSSVFGRFSDTLAIDRGRIAFSMKQRACRDIIVSWQALLSREFASVASVGREG
jgi:hypothetical protein